MVNKSMKLQIQGMTGMMRQDSGQAETTRKGFVNIIMIFAVGVILSFTLTACSNKGIDGTWVPKDSSSGGFSSITFDKGSVTIAGITEVIAIAGGSCTYKIANGELTVTANSYGQTIEIASYSFQKDGKAIFIDDVEYVLESDKVPEEMSESKNETIETEDPKEMETSSPIPEEIDLKLPISTKETTFVMQSYGSTLRISTEAVLQEGNKTYDAELGEYVMDWKDVDTDVRSIEYAENTILYIKKDNTLWGYGSNKNGMLGDGTGIDKDSPIKVLDDVACIFYNNGIHAIKTDKTLWEWGNGEDYSPVQEANDVVDVYSDALHLSTGTIISAHDDSPLESPGVPVYEYYKEGYGSTYWIDQERTLWMLEASSWTEEDGAIELSTEVEKFYMSENHLFFIKSDGSLWGMGDNGNGQLGDGTKVPRKEPIKISEDVVSAECYHYLKSNGELWVWDSEDPSPVKLLDDVADAYLNQVYLKDGSCITDLKNWVISDEQERNQYMVDGVMVPQTVVFP